ncbi:YraN family protein [Caloramator sp. Dgby_cultured_2]|nr:YraN family protein [Caloramator sp. Dgby_cultured_2]WDU84462.1 YraN family protein [Caloramator sp. Dgby_cultured_2]
MARDGRYLVFIEVKLRKSLNLGYPREAVDYYKQQRIRNLANLYLAKKE